MIIPVQIQSQGQLQGQLSVATPDKLEEFTLKDLNITEAYLEEFVRKNMELLFPDSNEETLLVVGQQVKNQQSGRSDLVAVDGDGNIVLIELKRDPADIANRKETFEMQAIRYAANYALISDPQTLVENLFGPYVEKHLPEFIGKHPNVTAAEIAKREIEKFLAANNADKDFNRLQRIILIAGDFDKQTLSACAWLAKNGIDIRCLRMSPRKYGQQLFLSIEQVIPPRALEEYFVGVQTSSQGTSGAAKTKSSASKQSLPTMPQLLAWGLIQKGTVLYIKNKPLEIAVVKDGQLVEYNATDMTYNVWGKAVTGYSSLNIYDYAKVRSSDNPLPSDKTLAELREEKMQQIIQVSSIQAIDDTDDVVQPSPLLQTS